MRTLTASVVVTTALLLGGCATLQRYPAFGTISGGGLVRYDRTAAHNLLPASREHLEARPALPQTMQPIH